MRNELKETTFDTTYITTSKCSFEFHESYEVPQMKCKNEGKLLERFFLEMCVIKEGLKKKISHWLSNTWHCENYSINIFKLIIISMKYTKVSDFSLS